MIPPLFTRHTSVKNIARSVTAVVVDRGKQVLWFVCRLLQAAVVLSMASKETAPSKGGKTPSKSVKKKGGATPEGSPSSPDKKSQTAKTSLSVQLPKIGARERSLSPASKYIPQLKVGKSPTEYAKPQREGARERSLSPASKDIPLLKVGKPTEYAKPPIEGERSLSPASKGGKSSRVYVKKDDGTPVPPPTGAGERLLSPASKDPPPVKGKSPTESAKPPTEGVGERSLSPASKDPVLKVAKSPTEYAKPATEGVRELSLSPASKVGKSPRVYVKKDDGTPVPPPIGARERSSPASKDLPVSKGGKSPTVFVDEASPKGATPHRYTPEISPVHDEDSATGGCFPCSPPKRLTPKKPKEKAGAARGATSPDKNTSFSMEENSVSTGCFLSPIKFHRSLKKPKKKGEAKHKNTPETSPVQDDDSNTARCLSPVSEGKKTGVARQGPNAGLKPVQKEPILHWIEFRKKQKQDGTTPDATSPDDKPTGTAEATPGATSDEKPEGKAETPGATSSDEKPEGKAGTTPGAISSEKPEGKAGTTPGATSDEKPEGKAGTTPGVTSSDEKPEGKAGTTPGATSPDEKPPGKAETTPGATSPDENTPETLPVQDDDSDTAKCLSPTLKERSACPHPAQASRQPEFTTPPTPHPRAPRQTSAATPAFGIDLSADAAAADTGVPLVVSLCVAVVDNWCEQNKSRATSAYCQQGEAKEMQAIVEAFNSGNFTITTLNGFTAHSVANILKKYLRELPNPVIPEDMYDRFIEFIKMGRTTTSGKTVTTLVDLVNDMPAVHGSTLRHLLAHFSKILRWQDESGVQEKFEKLLNVFSHILMRPPWDRISELAENTKHHNDVLHRLILEGVWGVIMPALPQPTAHRPTEPPDSDSSPERRLQDAPWYWAGISKDIARDVMMIQPERSFMVRDSTTEGDYTLLVKYQNSVKSIKIMSDGNCYGLVEPLVFPSVVTLINWYQCNSLATFNSILDTTLVVPVIRTIAPEQPSGSPAQEVEVLRIINKRYKKQQALYDYLYNWYSCELVDIELKSQACDTYKHLLNILDAQIGGLHATAGPRANQDIQRLVTARERVQDCINSLSEYINTQQGKHRLINGELSITTQEVHQLRKQRELWIAWLRARNMTQELLDRLADLNDPVWFVNCERAEATAILQGKLDGTFLIRPSRGENMHALSIMYQGEVTHCKILCVGDYYGFSEHSLSFTSLKDLVDYYHDRSLASHNEELDICLLYPVHLVHVQGPSGTRQL